MDEDVLFLADAEGAIGGLVFNGGVPPAIEVEDVVGLGQGDADPGSLQRQDKDGGRRFGILKGADHLLALVAIGAAVDVVGGVVAAMAQVLLQGVADFAKLAEDEGAFPFFDDLLQHFGKAAELVRSLRRKLALVLQKLAGMVADLLELGQGGENQSFALDALAAFELFGHVFEHRFVEGGLLFGEVAEQLLLHLVGQVFDDGLVGFDAAQDERLHQLFQGGGALGAVVFLDGHLELLAELGLGAEIAGIEKIEDGPEIKQAVLHGGAREGETVIGFQLEDGFGLGSFGVFDVLGFVQHDAVPGDAAKQLGVFAGEGEGGDHHVMVAAQGFEFLRVFGAIAAVMHYGL